MMRCLATLLCLGLVTQAVAGTLVVGATEFPPFEYTEDGRVVGAHTELLQAVILRMGHDMHAVLMPWARVELEAAGGRVDIVNSMSATVERRSRYYFSSPISSTRAVFFKRKDAAISYARLADLAGRRIGVCAGYAYPDEFTQLEAAGTLTATPLHGPDCDLRNLLKVAGGRLDLFISDAAVGNYYIRKHLAGMPQLQAIETLDRVIGGFRPVYVGFPRHQDPERDRRSRLLCGQFDAALRGTPAAEIAAILARYGVEPGREDAPPAVTAKPGCL